MGNNIFSSQFKSSAGEEYKVDLFSENYTDISVDFIGGSGQWWYIDDDWSAHLTTGVEVTLWDDDAPSSVARTILSSEYDETNKRTQVRFTVGSYSATYERMVVNEAITFAPDIIDIATEWETDGDPILAPIKASNTLLTYANNNGWFDIFFNTYLGTTDKELKLIIYKDNASTWELEWVGNVVPDLWEWDNMPKPRPFTIKAIDGLDMLKDIPYSDAESNPISRSLRVHIRQILVHNDLYQFWGASDPYIRESIEYKSNEVTGTLTDSHSPLDYCYIEESMFLNKEENEKVEGISCYDALKAILELFNCRMFISKGCYYIQQVRNYDNVSVIYFREYTKDMTSFSVDNYAFKMTAEGGARTEDLVVMAGGKFAYLAGLFRVNMEAKEHQQAKIYLNKYKGRIGKGINKDNPSFVEGSLGEIDGGVGNGANLQLNYKVYQQADSGVGDFLHSEWIMYQQGTVGIYRPIISNIGSKVQFDTFIENFDMESRAENSTTVNIYDSSMTLITTANILSLATNPTTKLFTIEVDATYSSTWAYVKTDDYTETYFFAGGVGQPNRWVTMEHDQITFTHKTYFNYIRIIENVNIETTEIPFSAGLGIIGEFTHNDNPSASGISKFWWAVNSMYLLVPRDGASSLTTLLSVENTTTTYTKELELDPLIITDFSNSTSLNTIQVREDYLTTNTTLVEAETWDAGFDEDEYLTITRIMEAMSLQYRPIERYLGKIEGQYYPHMCMSYNDKVYFFNAIKKMYAMDETDGEWIEETNKRTGFTPTEYEGWEDSEDKTTGGDSNSGLVGLFENNHKVSTVDSDADASGALTSLTIAANEVKLFAGETIVVVDPTNNEVTEELVLSADLAVGATTASIVSTSTTKDIVEGMFIQPKKDTIWNRVTTIQSDMNTDYMMEVAAGNIDGAFSVNVFGANQDVASGTEEDVNDVGGTYSYPTTADITHISQTIADGTMQNATIEIQGLDINWDLVTQSVDLSPGDTTDHIALTTALIRIFTMKVLDSVVASQDITAHNSGDTTTYATIIAGNNRTLMAQYTVPADHTAYMVSYYCDMVRSTNKDPKAVDFHMYAQDNANDYAWQIKHNKGIPQNGSGFQHFFKPYFKITEKTDIRLSAEPESTDAHVHAGFDIVVIENA